MTVRAVGALLPALRFGADRVLPHWMGVSDRAHLGVGDAKNQFGCADSDWGRAIVAGHPVSSLVCDAEAVVDVPVDVKACRPFAGCCVAVVAPIGISDAFVGSRDSLDDSVCGVRRVAVS